LRVTEATVTDLPSLVWLAASRVPDAAAAALDDPDPEAVLVAAGLEVAAELEVFAELEVAAELEVFAELEVGAAAGGALLPRRVLIRWLLGRRLVRSGTTWLREQ